MNFSKFANQNTMTNQVRASVNPSDFELFLETCSAVGDFYMGRVLSSIYWNAVISTYNAIKNQYGEHADTYIASMEKQKSSSADIVYWLHSEGYRPNDENNSIDAILHFVEEEFSIETETVLVIAQHIRELKKHNHLLSARMDKKLAMREFKLLPDDVREKYQSIIDGNLETQIANQKSAQDTVKAMFSVDKDVNIQDLDPQRLYVLVSKLNEKISDWIQKEEDKKFVESQRGNTFLVNNISATLELLDNAQAMSNKLLKEAEEVERSNTQEEIINKFENEHNGLNDQPDSAGPNQYNGGYNVA